MSNYSDRMTGSRTILVQKHIILFLVIGVSLLVSFLLSVCLGSTLLPMREVWSVFSLSGDADPVIRHIVMELRLPRATTALMAGGALAVAGLLMQTVFRNPLADPFVLGVNSGASLGVAIVILILAPTGVTLTQNLELSGQILIVISATIGSALTLMLILSISNRVGVMTLLIVGLMLSYAIGAIVSILMFFSMAERLQSFFTWSFGEFGNVTLGQLLVLAPVILIGFGVSALLIKPLDALLLGERYAKSLGINVRRTRFGVLFVASVLAGSVTGFCGPIGFLGIAAPHLCRNLFKTSSHRILIPASMMMGGVLATLADLIAKAPGMDFVLPLNAITALIGAPVIIVALISRQNINKAFG